MNVTIPTKEGVPVPEAAVGLYRRNLTFFSKVLPGVAKNIQKLSPQFQLAWDNAGDVNLYGADGRPVYKVGARAYARAQLEAFVKNPSRIVFAKPIVKWVDAKMEEDTAEKPTWQPEPSDSYLTQKYDNGVTDAHLMKVTKDIAKRLEAEGYGVTSKPEGYSPYFGAVYGVGLGFHLRPFVERYRPAVLILLESDLEWIYHSLFTFDWREFHDWMEGEGQKVRLIFDGDAFGMHQKLNATIQSECLLGLDGLLSFPHLLNGTTKIVFNEFQNSKTANLANFVGFTVDEYNMMKNSFRNLRSGDKRMLSAARVKAETPVIIVGSGPSLEDNLDVLRRVQDKAVIITSGSSLAVLKRNNIDADIHCNLERNQIIYERHAKLVEEGVDFSDVYAVMTTTIWPGIDKFFKDTVYFLRPALSPIGAFWEEDDQVLFNEGPQVTNTAVAFAGRLGFKEVYLLGVDLGSTDPKRPRASQAWEGQRPRYLTIPVRGNTGKTVFTDIHLVQQRQTLEAQIRRMGKEGVKFYNLGNGVRIEGALARRPADVSLPALNLDKKAHVKALIEQFPVYTRDRFLTAWRSAQVREGVASMIKQMVDALNESEGWDHKLIKRIEQINAYVGKAVRDQYAPRLLRGSLLRICMHLNAIFLRLEDKSQHEALYGAVREYMVDFLHGMEMEAYSLADELENEDEAFAVRYE